MFLELPFSSTTEPLQWKDRCRCCRHGGVPPLGHRLRPGVQQIAGKHCTVWQLNESRTMRMGRLVEAEGDGGRVEPGRICRAWNRLQGLGGSFGQCMSIQ